MNNLQELATALDGLDDFSISKTAHPVFVSGVKYPSLFNASLESGIHSVSIWKAIKKRGGGPAQIREALVVMESWVTSRAENVRKYYSL